MTRFAYVGNFGAPHSTENELRKAIIDAGHDVIPIQEDVRDHWETLAAGRLPDGAELDTVDVLLWTRTGWPWEARGWNDADARATQWRALSTAARLGVASIGYHLDRWWGLARETAVLTEPFFRCDLVVTADGGHDDSWARAGVRHVWFPPAVSRFECEPGTPRDKWRGEVVFVGSWRPGYHPEWRHRPELIRFLRSRYGNRTRFWPSPGQPAVRGDDLRDLYASSAVVVGDSCLAPNVYGEPMTCYWSDRIPETLGRGAFLLHPWVEGLDLHFELREMPAYGGPHLVTWPLGDWDALKTKIDYHLTHPDRRAEIARHGRAHVLAHHTYTRRVHELVDLLNERALIR